MHKHLQPSRWTWSLIAVVALSAAAVIADDAYVITNDARLVDQPKAFGAKTVTDAALNTKVEVVEGEVGKFNWAKVKVGDGKQGYIRGNALRSSPLEIKEGNVSANEMQYAKTAGAATKGWNSQIEQKNCQDDAAFKAKIELLNAFAKFLDEKLRKTGRFRADVDKFYTDGGFAPQNFEDSSLN